MRFLTGDEERQAFKFINEAVICAKKSTCKRARCGSVIVYLGEIIGSGFNSPPGEIEEQRCLVSKDSYDKKVTDKTCCVHAEQRAIINALLKNPEKLVGSRLYFIRINEENEVVKAKNPYCTICSKMALDVGIKEFVLWHEKGVCVYDTKEYNDLSFNYKAV